MRNPFLVAIPLGLDKRLCDSTTSFKTPSSIYSPAAILTEFQKARNHRRDGGVLVEFAMVALVGYMLLAAMITFGFLIAQVNIAQQIADVATQEIARTPFSANSATGLYISPPVNPGDDSLTENADFRSRIYDDRHLFVLFAAMNGQSLYDYAATANFPLINRLLVPVMIRDDELDAYRFPGAVVTKQPTNGDPSYPTVLIPLVNSDQTDIEWVPPVEEIMLLNENNELISQFNATIDDSVTYPSNFIPGMVALRINIPYQSAAMSGFQPNNPDGTPIEPGEPTIGNPIVADDPPGNEPGSGYTLFVGPDEGYDSGKSPIQIHGGRYGLGRQAAFAKWVRPYRKVISGQAAYRRESLVVQ